MGFSSYDDIISELTLNGKFAEWFFYKVSSVSTGATGVWTTCWPFAGTPGSGSAPNNNPGTSYTSATGSMYFTSSVSPDSRHLVSIAGVSTTGCTLMLYDRLVAVAGIQLSGSTGNRDVMSVALPRYADGVGVEAWLEVTTVTATTAPVVRMSSYTNQNGASGQSGDSVTFPAAATTVNSFIKLPIGSSDRGIRSIETLNVSTVGTTGIANVVLLKPLAYLPMVANTSNDRDLVLQLVSLPQIYDGASLALAYVSISGAATTIWGHLKVIHG